MRPWSIPVTTSPSDRREPPPLSPIRPALLDCPDLSPGLVRELYKECVAPPGIRKLIKFGAFGAGGWWVGLQFVLSSIWCCGGASRGVAAALCRDGDDALDVVGDAGLCRGSLLRQPGPRPVAPLPRRAGRQDAPTSSSWPAGDSEKQPGSGLVLPRPATWDMLAAAPWRRRRGLRRGSVTSSLIGTGGRKSHPSFAVLWSRPGCCCCCCGAAGATGPLRAAPCPVELIMAMSGRPGICLI